MEELAFAQAAAGSPAQQSPLLSMLPILIIFVIFYFLIIRPQKRTQEQHKKMISELKKNDEVMTSGGIYGTIVNMQDDVVTLRVDENTRIKVQRSAISHVKK